MNRSFKADAAMSQLVVIDMQDRLAGAMHEAEMQAVVKHCSILMQAATLLGVPSIVTEQYPKGLGHTLPALAALLPSVQPVEKTAFSCLAESRFQRQLTRDHSQIVLVGMETHICVLQTALDLINAGKQVLIAEDAVISRSANNKANALARMRDAGCVIANVESIVFEWLGAAEGTVFKTVSKLIR